MRTVLRAVVGCYVTFCMGVLARLLKDGAFLDVDRVEEALAAEQVVLELSAVDVERDVALRGHELREVAETAEAVAPAGGSREVPDAAPPAPCMIGSIR